jgi:hypothetical protein
VIVLANFSENECLLPANLIRVYGLSYNFIDLLRGVPIDTKDIKMEPYQLMVLTEI